MGQNLLSTDDFRAAVQSGSTPADATIYRFSTADPQTVPGATRTRRFVFSDSTVDHSNDSIEAAGWLLDTFRANPVALFAHDSSALPIGRAANVSVQNKKLVGDIEFADADTYPFADTVFRLVSGGFLKAVSVGFKPKKWKLTSDTNRPYGIDFKQQELLEISVCPIPANPSCLIEARSKGIDTRPLRDWAEQVLDGEGASTVARRDLESIRDQSSDQAARMHFAATLKRSLTSIAADTTPEARLRTVAELKRSIAASTETRQERMASAAQIRRQVDRLISDNPWL